MQLPHARLAQAFPWLTSVMLRKCISPQPNRVRREAGTRTCSCPCQQQPERGPTRLCAVRYLCASGSMTFTDMASHLRSWFPQFAALSVDDEAVRDCCCVATCVYRCSPNLIGRKVLESACQLYQPRRLQETCVCSSTPWWLRCVLKLRRCLPRRWSTMWMPSSPGFERKRITQFLLRWALSCDLSTPLLAHLYATICRPL